MESLLGLSASLHWAMGTGQFSFADLDSALLLKPAPVKSGITNSGRYIGSTYQCPALAAYQILSS